MRLTNPLLFAIAMFAAVPARSEFLYRQEFNAGGVPSDMRIVSGNWSRVESGRAGSGALLSRSDEGATILKENLSLPARWGMASQFMYNDRVEGDDPGCSLFSSGTCFGWANYLHGVPGLIFDYQDEANYKMFLVNRVMRLPDSQGGDGPIVIHGRITYRLLCSFVEVANGRRQSLETTVCGPARIQEYKAVPVALYVAGRQVRAHVNGGEVMVYRFPDQVRESAVGLRLDGPYYQGRPKSATYDYLRVFVQ